MDEEAMIDDVCNGAPPNEMRETAPAAEAPAEEAAATAEDSEEEDTTDSSYDESDESEEESYEEDEEEEEVVEEIALRKLKGSRADAILTSSAAADAKIEFGSMDETEILMHLHSLVECSNSSKDVRANSGKKSRRRTLDLRTSKQGNDAVETADTAKLLVTGQSAKPSLRSTLNLVSLENVLKAKAGREPVSGLSSPTASASDVREADGKGGEEEEEEEEPAKGGRSKLLTSAGSSSSDSIPPDSEGGQAKEEKRKEEEEAKGASESAPVAESEVTSASTKASETTKDTSVSESTSETATSAKTESSQTTTDTEKDQKGEGKERPAKDGGKDGKDSESEKGKEKEKEEKTGPFQLGKKRSKVLSATRKGSRTRDKSDVKRLSSRRDKREKKEKKDKKKEKEKTSVADSDREAWEKFLSPREARKAKKRRRAATESRSAKRKSGRLESLAEELDTSFHKAVQKSEGSSGSAPPTPSTEHSQHSVTREESAPATLSDTPSLSSSLPEGEGALSAPATPPAEKEMPKLMILRVKLFDGTHKTFPITASSTAAQIHSKLVDKLKKERPDCEWDRCLLYSELAEAERRVASTECLMPIISSGCEIKFKIPGEKEVDREEELKRIERVNRANQQMKAAKRRAQEKAAEEESKAALAAAAAAAVATGTIARKKKSKLPVTAAREARFNDVSGFLSKCDKDLQLKLMKRKIEMLEDDNDGLRKRISATKSKAKRNKWMVDLRNVRVTEKIAGPGGSFAMVYSVDVDGWRCAMKELILDGSVVPDMLLTEIAVLSALPFHDNIVKFLFFEHDEQRIRLFITLYNGSLQDEIARRRKEQRHFTLLELKQHLRDMVNGLAFLHSYSIMHRDLKSGNVFAVTGVNHTVQKLVLADYDTATQIQDQKVPLRQTTGTPGFMAPEVLEAKERGYGLKGDIFSLGMIIYELLALKTPYEELESSFDISSKILAGERPPLGPTSPELLPYVNLFLLCTSSDAEDRPSAFELKEIVSKLPTTKEAAEIYLAGQPYRVLSSRIGSGSGSGPASPGVGRFAVGRSATIDSQGTSPLTSDRTLDSSERSAEPSDPTCSPHLTADDDTTEHSGGVDTGDVPEVADDADSATASASLPPSASASVPETQTENESESVSAGDSTAEKATPAPEILAAPEETAPPPPGDVGAEGSSPLPVTTELPSAMASGAAVLMGKSSAEVTAEMIHGAPTVHREASTDSSLDEMPGLEPTV
mmetsp:Transcript_17728/g.68764  ORF Transcript_17728/g.68764 Transcript_17728/m.68764 type:complete len:1230 (+) Transcript_17728:140-3829(+)